MLPCNNISKLKMCAPTNAAVINQEQSAYSAPASANSTYKNVR